MRDHTFRVLEYYSLLEHLSRYASSPLGRDKCLSLRPLINKVDIEKEHKLVSEMRLLQQVKGVFSFNGVVPIDSFIARSGIEDYFLEPEDLLHIQVLIDNAESAIVRIRENRDICPELNRIVSNIRACGQVSREIKKAINPYAKINDNASPALRKIREHKIRLRRSISKRLEEILLRIKGGNKANDGVISLRDGRYVISIRTDNKGSFKGIIHDYSHTRARCFFEPMEVIEENNELAKLSHQEREEEISILKRLTSHVHEHGEHIKTHQSLIALLDGLRARALFGERIKGVSPVFNDNDMVKLKGARHPILTLIYDEGKGPVPLDIVFGRDKRLMIISGPNRGGKTVTLKTIGLISLMAQAGIPVPVEEGSSICIFRDIMAEIGDEQSLSAGLSTFSAHMMHLKDMIDNATKESLIIIDEPGFGTDPDEGASLAMAILDKLMEKGGLIVVSTHFNSIKSYGILKKNTVNASMGFDDKTKRPTFSLRYGTTGTSYAYEIAGNCGIGEKIIQRAKGYIDKDEVRLNGLIEKLNRIIEEAEYQKAQALKIKNKYIDALKKASKRIIELEKRKRKEIDEIKNRYQEILVNAKSEIRDIINEFKQKGSVRIDAVREKYNSMMDQLNIMLPESSKEAKQVIIKDLKEGQKVRHKKTGKSGEILLLDKTHSKAVLSAGNIKIMVPLDEIEPFYEDQRKSGHGEYVNIITSHGMKWKELNVVGLRVEEAIDRVEKEIDRAILNGTSGIRIIHGHGTGRLRKAIREYLRNSSYVRSISGADPFSGGDAVTIVELE